MYTITGNAIHSYVLNVLCFSKTLNSLAIKLKKGAFIYNLLGMSWPVLNREIHVHLNVLYSVRIDLFLIWSSWEECATLSCWVRNTWNQIRYEGNTYRFPSFAFIMRVVVKRSGFVRQINEIVPLNLIATCSEGIPYLIIILAISNFIKTLFFHLITSDWIFLSLSYAVIIFLWRSKANKMYIIIRKDLLIFWDGQKLNCVPLVLLWAWESVVSW